jgi:hypothetical protein
MKKCSKAEKPESLFLVFGSPEHRLLGRLAIEEQSKRGNFSIQKGDLGGIRKKTVKT